MFIFLFFYYAIKGSLWFPLVVNRVSLKPTCSQHRLYLNTERLSEVTREPLPLHLEECIVWLEGVNGTKWTRRKFTFSPDKGSSHPHEFFSRGPTMCCEKPGAGRRWRDSSVRCRCKTQRHAQTLLSDQAEASSYEGRCPKPSLSGARQTQDAFVERKRKEHCLHLLGPGMVP